MAGPLSISSIYSYVSSYNNKAANLKAFFAYGFDIQIANPDSPNKWVIHRFDICAATYIPKYELWACIQIDFKKFKAKHFNILDGSI